MEDGPRGASRLAPVARLQIAAGLTHTLVCTDNGELFSFGGGRYGQLGLEREKNEAIPKRVGAQSDNETKEDQLLRCAQVAAGAHHSAALGFDGNLYTWGQDANGRLGHGPTDGPGYKNKKTKKMRTSNCPMKVYAFNRKKVMQVRESEEWEESVGSSMGRLVGRRVGRVVGCVYLTISCIIHMLL